VNLRILFALLLTLVAAACGNLLGLEDRKLDGDYPPGGYEGCRNGNCSECSLEYHRCRCEGRSVDVCFRDFVTGSGNTGFARCKWGDGASCADCPTMYTSCVCKNHGETNQCPDPETDPEGVCREHFGNSDSCASCLCGACGNELSGCLEDAGCTALLDCIRENPCTLAMGAEDSCYDGACADDFEQYGQQGGRALSLLLTAGACINGPGQGCPCNDPNNCCSTENPCGFSGNGRCDCPGMPWDLEDCGDCCFSDNPCGLSNNSICECPNQLWDENDCQSGGDVECGSSICYGSALPFTSGTVAACCPPQDPNQCGLQLGTALPGWPGDACSLMNAPGVHSDECPTSEPYRLPGQPDTVTFPGCCTSGGECGVMLDTGGFVNLGCQVNFPTADPKPSSCDPEGVVCDFDCVNCPSCASQCRCLAERYSFSPTGFQAECEGACAGCATDEDMCGGCSDSFGDCLCDGGDAICCRDSQTTEVCSPYDNSSCSGQVQTACQDCATTCDSCVCNGCQFEWSQCLEDAGCGEIWECIQETQCDLCYAPGACQDVIDQNGGPEGDPMSMVSNLLYCAQQTFSGCAADCPDACVPPSCTCGDCMSQCLCQSGGATEQCELKCNGACSPEAGCKCGNSMIAACICNGQTKAECEQIYGLACDHYSCLDQCLCGGSSLDICATEQCLNAEVTCGFSTCYGREFPDNKGFSWLAPPCCPPPPPGGMTGIDVCGLEVDTWGNGFRGCWPTVRPGGENTGCPSKDAMVGPFSYELPGCCSMGVCGYLDYQFATFGCIDSMMFGDPGGGC